MDANDPRLKEMYTEELREQEVQRAKEEQLRLRKEAHEHWLQHPVTIQLLTVLNNHQNELLDSNSGSSDRILAAIYTVRAIRKIVLNPELFIKLSINQ